MVRGRLLIDTVLPSSEIKWLEGHGITTLEQLSSKTWEEIVQLVGEQEAYRLLPIGLAVLAAGATFMGMTHQELEEYLEEIAGHPVTLEGTMNRWTRIHHRVILPPHPAHVAA